MNIKDAKSVLKYAKVANDVPLLKGLQGIGKTSIVKQYCSENNYHYEELILSLMEPSDLLGMPNSEKDENGSKTVWDQPDWFQTIVNQAWPCNFDFEDLEFNDKNFFEFCSEDITTRKQLNDLYCEFYKLPNDRLQLITNQTNVSCRKSKESVLFLDEINRAGLDTRQSSMQLVLEKKLHNHILPFVKGRPTFIVAAMNSSNEDVDFQVDELDAALLDRFLELDLDIDVASWVEYSRENKVNPIVIDFIIDNDKKLHFVPNDGSTCATPRSWEKLAKYVDDFENIPSELHYNICKGKVGSAIGSQFVTFYNNYSKNITIKDIEEIVKEKSTDTETIEELSEHVKELIETQEVIKKHDLIEQLFEKYTKKEVQECLPLLATAYALETEVIMGFITKVKESKYNEYKIMSSFDKELNGHNLFKGLAKNLKR